MTSSPRRRSRALHSPDSSRDQIQWFKLAEVQNFTNIMIEFETMASVLPNHIPRHTFHLLHLNPLMFHYDIPCLIFPKIRSTFVRGSKSLDGALSSNCQLFCARKMRRSYKIIVLFSMYTANKMTHDCKDTVIKDNNQLDLNGGQFMWNMVHKCVWIC